LRKILCNITCLYLGIQLYCSQNFIKEKMSLSVKSRIGVDESGKGDYFGPLVIGGVYLDEESEKKLKEWKVRDSKRISDKMILSLDYQIRSFCLYSVVVINPEKYNLLYQKMRNLNRILAWGHARVIENILAQKEASLAISDQFGEERFILNALMKLGKQIELKQMPQAEVDLAVAAASVIARAEFLRRIDKLSQEWRINLPKGASNLVDEVAAKIVNQSGKESLDKLAKLHFKNTRKVLCPNGSILEKNQKDTKK
jgi:ribonuclease HIII